MLLCKDCRHFRGTDAPHECEAPQNRIAAPDYANGGEIIRWQWSTIAVLRGGATDPTKRCGNEADWFEPIAEKVTP